MITETERLKEILSLDIEFTNVKDFDILLERILSEARRITKADAGSIYLREEDDLLFIHAQNETLQKQLPKGQKLIYLIFKVKINTKSIAGYVASTGKTLNISDVYEIEEKSPYRFDPKFDQMSNYKTTSMLTVPLKDNRNYIMGVFQIINKKDQNDQIIPFTSEDEIICLHFANTASMALQRTQLTRELILRMIRIAELRDPKETGPHVNRVASYATEIYERWAQMQYIPQEEINRRRDIIRMAAMIHDVGKVAISDTILKKPGRLNTKEREIMKAHTYMGARLFLERQSEFDEVAYQVTLRHHENWDGTGYPGYIDVETGKPAAKNLMGEAIPFKGKEIPIFGRIVAVADVYDALQSKRVYKEAWKEDDVLREMRKLSGEKFDPELVEALFGCLDILRMITKRYPENNGVM